MSKVASEAQQESDDQIHEDQDQTTDQDQDQTADQDPDQTGLPAGLKLPKITPAKGSKQPGGGWSSSLFGCMKSPCNALVTCFCPCITFGRTAEILDEGHISCCVTAMVSLGSVGLWFFGLPCGTVKLLSSYRAKLRAKFSIAESPAHDWAIHSVCCLCGLCQEYRELKHRGFDPALGWKKNIEKMDNKNSHQEQTVKPPSNQRVERS